MDAVMIAASRLREQGVSTKEISRRLHVSEQKVRKILVTIGAIDTEEAKLYQQGMTIDEIAKKLNKARNSVIARIPYSKGIYNAEYPTKNALAVRRSKARKRAAAEAAAKARKE